MNYEIAVVILVVLLCFALVIIARMSSRAWRAESRLSIALRKQEMVEAEMARMNEGYPDREEWTVAFVKKIADNLRHATLEYDPEAFCGSWIFSVPISGPSEKNEYVCIRFGSDVGDEDVVEHSLSNSLDDEQCRLIEKAAREEFVSRIGMPASGEFMAKIRPFVSEEVADMFGENPNPPAQPETAEPTL